MANWLQLIGLVVDLIAVVLMARGIFKIDKRIGTWGWLESTKEC
jgi:hypothetical protein